MYIMIMPPSSSSPCAVRSLKTFFAWYWTLYFWHLGKSLLPKDPTSSLIGIWVIYINHIGCMPSSQYDGVDILIMTHEYHGLLRIRVAITKYCQKGLLTASKMIKCSTCCSEIWRIVQETTFASWGRLGAINTKRRSLAHPIRSFLPTSAQRRLAIVEDMTAGPTQVISLLNEVVMAKR